METQLARFQKRKRLKNSITNYDKIDETEVSKILNSNIDEEKINGILQETKKYYNTDVSKDEIKLFIDKFQKDFNDEKFDKLIMDCKKNVINSITTPLGLGNFVAAYDKVGGNVTTTHNAKQKIYANEEDKYKRDDYVKSAKSIGGERESFSTVREKTKATNINANGQIKDANTGLYHNATEMDLDHDKSLENFHNEGGFMISDKDKREFGADTENHSFTHSSTNRSKGSQDHKTFSDNKKNKEKYNLDNRRTNAVHKRGEKTAEKYLPNTKEKAIYYSSKITSTGINEGAKMGMQQALGLVMSKFFNALFDEMLNIYKGGFDNGFDNDKFFTILKKRLLRVAKKIKEEWKDVAIAFKDGFVSGFISNFITTLTNMFVKTGKRVIRIIREGVFPLFRAAMLLLFPPKNMSSEDVKYKVNKILAEGIIISLGIITAEYIDILIKSIPILEPFTELFTTVFTGAMTGIAITIAVYQIDKKKNDKEMFNYLIADTNTKLNNLSMDK